MSMWKFSFRRMAIILIASLAIPTGGCGVGDENDRAFLKEAGVGTPIENFDQGYAARKEKRQSEIDAQAKASKSKKKGRG